MGRELRRVPPDWEHPRDWHGDYIHMYDQPYREAADEWLAECASWQDGTHPKAAGNKESFPYYWEWAGMPPDSERFRPEWESEPTHYQVYETVSEGTPVSPVFATLDEVRGWLVSEGWNDEFTEGLIEFGSVPSGIARQTAKGVELTGPMVWKGEES